MKAVINNDPKQGKQEEPNTLAHKDNVNSMYEAHRLEGKVKNMGIKNIGHQKKKSSSK